MKRMIFLAAFAAFAMSVSAQKTDYRIDRLTDGAIYLVEISIPAPDSTGTIGKATEYPLKFQDDAALSAFIDQMRAIATKTRQAAEQKALVLDNAAERIAGLLKPAQAPEKPKARPEKKTKKQ